MQLRTRSLATVVIPCIVVACSKPASNGADSANATAPAMADHSADERIIVAADSAWMHHVVAKNVDSLMTYYTPDAVSYGFGAPASGTDQIRALYTEMAKATVADPKVNSNTIKFSDDGSMAFDHGTYEMTMTPPGGKASREAGAFLNVWKKVDGQWKLAAEMSSPLAAPKK